MNKSRQAVKRVTESTQDHWNKVEMLPVDDKPAWLDGINLVRRAARPVVDSELVYSRYDDVVLFGPLDYIIKSYAIFVDEDGDEYAFTWD